MAKQLSKLERVNLTTISFEGLVDLLRSIIQQDSSFDSIEDFMDSNAGRVLSDYFAFYTSQILKRMDIAMQEAFITTARQPDSVLKLLALIGAKVRSSTGAIVPITLQITPTPTGSFELPARYALEGTDLNGDPVTFELLASATDYTSPIIIPAGSSSVELVAYAGKTVIEDIEVDSRENFSYTFTQNPVIEDSVQLFLETAPNVYEEMSIYDNFLHTLEAVPIATLDTDFDGRKTMRTGTEDLGGDFDTIVDSDPNTYMNIRSFYRVGGGKNTNVFVGAIKKTTNFFSVELTRTFSLFFYNHANGGGGTDVQTLEDVKLNAPLQVKTADKLVTNEDGEILLNANTSVKDSLVITPNEEPKLNIPIFHTNVYIAPIRSWSDFIPADPNNPTSTQIPASDFGNGETQAEYIERLIAAANNFLNVSGISESTALVLPSVNQGPFTISVSNNIFKLNVDTQGEITVVLTSGVRSAAQIALDINAAIGYSLAAANGNFVELTSPTLGESGSIEIISSSALPTLGFTVGIYTGVDNSGEAQILLDQMAEKSVVGIGHIIKPVVFTPFFISGNIIASKTASLEIIIPQIKDKIYEMFDYESENTKFKRKIIVSRIVREIMNIDGINEFKLINPSSNKTPLTNEIFFMFGEDVLAALPNDDYPNLSSQFGINLTISRELNDYVEI